MANLADTELVKRERLAKNSPMQDRALQFLRCLSDAPVITVEPGFTVASRISHGVHGDGDDLAFSAEWCDANGCLWAADFSENALAHAAIEAGLVSLCDVGGEKVVFQLYQPTRQINLPSQRK